MRLSVIAPTYNEAGNLRPLVDALQRALSGLDFEIVIADDDSPDLTWKQAEDMGRRDSRVHVLRRTTNRGLAAAVMDGFAAASGEVVACIDADLQHDPAILPEMLRQLQAGADLVVGSRYVAGGGVGDWNWLRRVESWAATKLAQLALGVKLHDPMSGYFMVRREDLLRLRSKLHTDGFKIMLEIAARMKPHQVREVPYTFRPRTAGESKLTRKVVYAYFRQLYRLSRLSWVLPTEILKFLLVGGSGIAVNIAALAVLIHATTLRDWRASAIATVLATVNNYILHNVWTFRDRSHKGVHFVRNYFSYFLVSLVGMAVTTLTFTGMAHLLVRATNLGGIRQLPNAALLGAQLIGIASGTLFNYLLNRLLTWPPPKSRTHQF